MSGPDIFLSYNREDAARAKHFADGFAAVGFEVLWDVALRPAPAIIGAVTAIGAILCGRWATTISRSSADSWTSAMGRKLTFPRFHQPTQPRHILNRIILIAPIQTAAIHLEGR